MVRWLLQPRWPQQPLCPGPAHTGLLLPHAGCSQWENTTAAHTNRGFSEEKKKKKHCAAADHIPMPQG